MHASNLRASRPIPKFSGLIDPNEFMRAAQQDRSQHKSIPGKPQLICRSISEVAKTNSCANPEVRHSFECKIEKKLQYKSEPDSPIRGRSCVIELKSNEQTTILLEMVDEVGNVLYKKPLGSESNMERGSDRVSFVSTESQGVTKWTLRFPQPWKAAAFCNAIDRCKIQQTPISLLPTSSEKHNEVGLFDVSKQETLISFSDDDNISTTKTYSTYLQDLDELTDFVDHGLISFENTIGTKDRVSFLDQAPAISSSSKALAPKSGFLFNSLTNLEGSKISDVRFDMLSADTATGPDLKKYPAYGGGLADSRFANVFECQEDKPFNSSAICQDLSDKPSEGSTSKIESQMFGRTDHKADSTLRKSDVENALHRIAEKLSKSTANPIRVKAQQPTHANSTKCSVEDMMSKDFSTVEKGAISTKVSQVPDASTNALSQISAASTIKPPQNDQEHKTFRPLIKYTVDEMMQFRRNPCINTKNNLPSGEWLRHASSPVCPKKIRLSLQTTIRSIPKVSDSKNETPCMGSDKSDSSQINTKDDSVVAFFESSRHPRSFNNSSHLFPDTSPLDWPQKKFMPHLENHDSEKSKTSNYSASDLINTHSAKPCKNIAATKERDFSTVSAATEKGPSFCPPVHEFANPQSTRKFEVSGIQFSKELIGTGISKSRFEAVKPYSLAGALDSGFIPTKAFRGLSDSRYAIPVTAIEPMKDEPETQKGYASIPNPYYNSQNSSMETIGNDNEYVLPGNRKGDQALNLPSMNAIVHLPSQQSITFTQSTSISRETESKECVSTSSALTESTTKPSSRALKGLASSRFALPSDTTTMKSSLLFTGLLNTLDADKSINRTTILPKRCGSFSSHSSKDSAITVKVSLSAETKDLATVSKIPLCQAPSGHISCPSTDSSCSNASFATASESLQPFDSGELPQLAIADEPQLQAMQASMALLSIDKSKPGDLEWRGSVSKAYVMPSAPLSPTSTLANQSVAVQEKHPLLGVNQESLKPVIPPDSRAIPVNSSRSDKPELPTFKSFRIPATAQQSLRGNGKGGLSSSRWAKETANNVHKTVTASSIGLSEPTSKHPSATRSSPDVHQQAEVRIIMPSDATTGLTVPVLQTVLVLDESRPGHLKEVTGILKLGRPPVISHHLPYNSEPAILSTPGLRNVLGVDINPQHKLSPQFSMSSPELHTRPLNERITRINGKESPQQLGEGQIVSKNDTLLVPLTGVNADMQRQAWQQLQENVATPLPRSPYDLA